MLQATKRSLSTIEFDPNNPQAFIEGAGVSIRTTSKTPDMITLSRIDTGAEVRLDISVANKSLSIEDLLIYLHSMASMSYGDAEDQGYKGLVEAGMDPSIANAAVEAVSFESSESRFLSMLGAEKSGTFIDDVVSLPSPGLISHEEKMEWARREANKLGIHLVSSKFSENAAGNFVGAIKVWTRTANGTIETREFGINLTPDSTTTMKPDEVAVVKTMLDIFGGAAAEGDFPEALAVFYGLDTAAVTEAYFIADQVMRDGLESVTLAKGFFD